MSVDRLIAAAILGAIVWVVSSDKKAAPEIQELFDGFHENIKLEEHDERRKLREKREVLVSTLKSKLASESLKFEPFDQGSYAMRTGVIPFDGNYDIDVGLIFDCPPERFPDPLVLKCIVRDSLCGNKRTVEIRRACVTVTYFKGGLPDYHVDLALYLRRPDGTLVLAKGREFSDQENCQWVPSAPKELTQFILSKFSGEEQGQFRRCIRYLKRWRDENFRSGAPLSIALTVAAATWFEPKSSEDGKYVDLEALLALVKKMRSQFGNGWVFNRLAVNLPGPVKADLMSGLTNIHMRAFSERLKGLQQALEKCLGDVSVGDSATILRAQFGLAFPAAIEATS